MIRAVLFALFLTLAAPVHAQNPFRIMLECTGTQGPNPLLPAVAPVAMPKGFAGTDATCTGPIVGIADTGWVVGWACRKDGVVSTTLAAVRKADITTEMLLSAAAIPAADDPREAWRAHAQRFSTTDFYNMCDVWGHPSTDWKTRFIAATDPFFVPLPPPPPEVWRTPATATGTIYKVVAGKRVSIVAGKKAPLNSVCDCTRLSMPYLQGAAYCTLPTPAPADEVTLCRKM